MTGGAGDGSCSSGLWGPESPHTCHLRHPGHSLGPTLSSSLTAHVPPLFPPDSRYLTPLVCIGFTALTPLCILIAKQNPPIVKILKFGWFPIVLAMLVSRCVGGDALGSGWVSRGLGRLHHALRSSFPPRTLDLVYCEGQPCSQETSTHHGPAPPLRWPGPAELASRPQLCEGHSRSPATGETYRAEGSVLRGPGPSSLILGGPFCLWTLTGATPALSHVLP